MGFLEIWSNNESKYFTFLNMTCKHFFRALEKSMKIEINQSDLTEDSNLKIWTIDIAESQMLFIQPTKNYTMEGIKKKCVFGKGQAHHVVFESYFSLLGLTSFSFKVQACN